MEEAGRAWVRMPQRRFGAKDDEGPARAPERDRVAAGIEHAEGHDVAVVPGHPVEVADQERDRAH